MGRTQGREGRKEGKEEKEGRTGTKNGRGKVGDTIIQDFSLSRVVFPSGSLGPSKWTGTVSVCDGV